MSLVILAREQARQRAQRLAVSKSFDWRRVDRPAHFAAPSLRSAIVLPVALLVLVGAGVAFAWAVSRQETQPPRRYRLAEIGSQAASEVGETRLERHREAAPKTPIIERVVRKPKAKRVIEAAPAPTKKEKAAAPAIEGPLQPTVIIVKPPAKLPPLFSPEAYRRRR